MSEQLSPATSPPRESFLQRHYFLFRRLHSLTGILPIGVFLIAHLLTNSTLAWGKLGLRSEVVGRTAAPESWIAGGVHYFLNEVTWINQEVPYLVLIEIVLWVSIAFHATLGAYYATTGHSNTSRYGYGANVRYTLQRATGWFGILFIFYHVASLRWGWTWLVPGGALWNYQHAASTLAAAIQGTSDGHRLASIGTLVALFYFVGVSALVFHFANGLWTAAITWGLTVSAGAQKRWGYVCAAMGVALMAAAWSSVFMASTINVKEARAVEDRVLQTEGVPPMVAPAKESLGAR